MRSILILLISIVVIGGAFALYVWRQTSHASVGSHVVLSERDKKWKEQSPATSPANPDLPVTAGDYGSFESYDKVTGDLSSRFKAARYDPQPDGTINTTSPQGEFFLQNGQVMRIHGTTGEIVMPPSSNAGKPAGGKMGGRTQMPTRGLLHNVVLQMYVTADAKKPSMTCTMNNASFDNETFSVSTEAFDDPKTGRHVDADQVPITMRGEKDGPFPYDFDGRGLHMQWDERDRKLQLLEIAHGQKLTILHPKAMHFGEASTKPAAVSAPTPNGSSMTNDPFAVQLASADPSAAKQMVPPPAPAKRAPRRRPARPSTQPVTLPTTGPATRPKLLEPYRATFNDNVHVTQDAKEIAHAELMNVDFDQVAKSRDNQDEGTTDENGDRIVSPSPPQPAAPAVSSSTNSKPPKPAKPPVRATQPATQAASTTAPSTQPDEAPMVVTWTGMLRVAPMAADEPDLPEGSNDSVLEMVGKLQPVDVDWQGSKIHCGSFRYHTADDTAAVHSSLIVPQVSILDSRGAHIVGPSVDYSGVQRIADIPGPSYIEFPVEDSASSAAKRAATLPASTTLPASQSTTQPTTQMARIDWIDSCFLQMTDGPRQQMTVDHAEFDGDVRVAHPQMELQSETLQVDFVPVDRAPTTKPTRAQKADASTRPGASTQPGSNLTIRQLVATESVHTAIRDPNRAADAPPQTIDCDQLLVAFELTDDGKAFPKVLTADGSVIAGDGQSQLESAHLDALMRPSTQPTADATTKPDGQSMPSVQLQSLFANTNVRGQTLDGRTIEAEQLQIQTKPDGTPEYKLLGPPDARLGTGTTTLSGPIITFDPSTGLADVIGAGTMHSIQQGHGGSATRPASTQPIAVAWSDHMHADTSVNRVDILGNVVADSTMEDGTHNVVHGATMTLTLADAATTRPTTGPATSASTTQSTKSSKASTKPATRTARGSMFGASGGSGGQDSFKDKVVQTVTVNDPTNVEVVSTLSDAAGNLLRRLNLFAPTLNYNPLLRRLTVPVAGRMLYIDNRAEAATQPTTQPTTRSATQPTTMSSTQLTTKPTSRPAVVRVPASQPATTASAKPKLSPANAIGDMHGATAFEWKKNLIYDDALHTVTLNGDVVVVHQADNSGTEGYRLTADQLIAVLDSSDDATTKPTTKPTTAPTTVPTTTATTKPATKPTTDESTLGGAKLKHLIADGSVVFVAQRLHFEAQHIDFDPQSNVLTAHGSARDPATLFDDNGLSEGTFETMVYDTKSDRMKLTNFRAVIRR